MIIAHFLKKYKKLTSTPFETRDTICMLYNIFGRNVKKLLMLL